MYRACAQAIIYTLIGGRSLPVRRSQLTALNNTMNIWHENFKTRINICEFFDTSVLQYQHDMLLVAMLHTYPWPSGDVLAHSIQDVTRRAQICC